MAKKAASKS